MVLGGNGVVGAGVIRQLIKRGQHPVSFDTSLDSFRLSDLEGRFTAVQGDISDVRNIVEAIVAHEVTDIVHLAFPVGRPLSPYEHVQVHASGTNNVFEAARLTGVRRVLHASSVARNSPQAYYGDRVIDETEGSEPQGIYGQTKQYNEWLASAYVANYGMSIAAVRIAVAFYGSPRPGGPAMPSHIIALPAVGKPVHLVVEPSTVLPLAYTDDLGEIFARLLEVPKLNHEVYFSGGHAIDFYGLADMVRELIPSADITFGEAQFTPFDFVSKIDPSRLKEEIAFEHPPLRERVLDCIEEARRLAARANSA